MNRRSVLGSIIAACAGVFGIGQARADEHEIRDGDKLRSHPGRYVGDEAGCKLWFWRYKDELHGHGYTGWLETEDGELWGFVVGDGQIIRFLDGPLHELHLGHLDRPYRRAWIMRVGNPVPKSFF